MRALFRFFSLRHLARHPARALLGAVAVALGVALYVSIDTANTSIAAAFEKSASDLAGKAEIEIVTRHGVGVDAAALDVARRVPGCLAAPVLQRAITFEGLPDPQVLAIGVDFTSDAQVRMWSFEGQTADPKPFIAAAFVPNAIILTTTYAERNGLRKGSKLRAATPRGLATLVVTGLVDLQGPARALGGSVAVLPMPAAQQLFGLKGRFDRIEVAPQGVPADALLASLSAALGPKYDVRRVSHRNTSVEIALARLRSMVVISAIALVVGLFIVYNAVSISVVERVREIGILRSLGAKRSQVLATVVMEWTFVGALGSSAGVAAGWALARILVGQASRGVNMLVFSVRVEDVVFSWSGAAIAVAAGTLTAAGAAFFPGIAAMAVTPISLLRQGTYQYRQTPRFLAAFVAGALLLAGGSATLLLWGDRLPPGALLVITTVAFFAIALLGPQATVWLARASRPLLWRFLRIEGTLAADNLARFPARTGLTVAAFGGAISILVAATALVSSFRSATGRWMEVAFPFDLTVNASDLSMNFYSAAGFGEDVLEASRKVEGVEAAYGVRSRTVPWGPLEIMVLSVDLEGFFAMHRAHGTKGGPLDFDTPQVRATMASGEGVVISENMAALDGLRPGDSVNLPTPSGSRSFRILGTIEDYSWPIGTVLLDRAAYARLWDDPTLTYVDIRLSPGADPDATRARLATALRDHSTIFVYSVPQLQDVARSAFDQVIALTRVQVLLAMTIGFLGIVNTLLISVLLRTREIGLVRAVGSTRAQVRRTVAVESVLIAIGGSALGIGAGLAGAAWPIRLYILRMAGFWFPLVIPWGDIALAVGAGAVLGLIASIVPARRAARLNVLDAISYE
ncbi:MAG: FtsX-like permease family protein [Planctomycetia bacterium]|nr:FtsX-like permease family protein [Planctomycetia bacterium]